MTKFRVLIVAAVIGFLFSLGVSSARADALHSEQLAENTSTIGQQSLSAASLFSSEANDYLYDVQSGGKHSGFSAASIHLGPRMGLVGYNPTRDAVAPTPEPATMALLGTGLAAIGAFGRRRTRKTEGDTK